jgi:PilZ domain
MPERGATDICVMSPLSPVDAVSLLFNSPDVELELAGGGLLRVHAILVEGERVTATAPRLSVATGMLLTGRVVGPDGRPWELKMHVDDAAYHTPDLAMLRMHPTAVGVDESRRAAERVPIGGVAWLEAVNCQDVVDRDRVDGSLEDLSRSGVAFTTARVLRVGDRLLFHGRFFADSISGEVRVASVRPATAPGQTVVGCRFLDIDDGSVAKIDRILNGGREPDSRSAGFDVSSLRDLAAGAEESDEPSGSSWFGRLKRREP